MIDLHIHTTCSDGQLTVEQLLKKVNSEGISVISFCDHNVLGAYQVHSCGGKVVLAHPFDYKDINHKQYIQDIYNLGILDGIECLHTRHGIEQIEYIKCFCQKNKLLITGGSDFHRELKQTLGYGAGGTIPITEEYCLKNVNNF